jgi:hypothetical protein
MGGAGGEWPLTKWFRGVVAVEAAGGGGGSDGGVAGGGRAAAAIGAVMALAHAAESGFLVRRQ